MSVHAAGASLVTTIAYSLMPDSTETENGLTRQAPSRRLAIPRPPWLRDSR